MPYDAARVSSARSWRIGLALLAIGVPVGGAGCSAQPAAKKPSQATTAGDANAEKQKQQSPSETQEEPLEISTPTPQFSEPIAAADGGGSIRLAKPGHWTATVQTIKANDEDFEGRATLAATDGRGRPLPTPYTPLAIVSSRPALLAKGVEKRILGELLVPPQAERVRVTATLVSGGAEVKRSVQPWRLMPSHQYYLVVLAREPARYSYLKVADAIRAPQELGPGNLSPPHYRVALADAGRPLPLPGNVMAWTSLAYVVWDEVATGRLDPSQQQALVDWLHWGGRLIISGPDSLASLRGSFLDRYLPADLGPARTYAADDLATLEAHWTKRANGKPVASISVARPWSGVELKPRTGRAQALPGCEGLFFESGVGAGSIVVSAVRLTERDLINWPGFDGFLNGVLLRRPPRSFRVDDGDLYGGLQTLWAGARNLERTHDAYFTTPLRWFSRDAATRANARQIQADLQGQTAANAPWQSGAMPVPETRLEVDRAGGLGSWNDFGPAAEAARESLRDAAGVRVPAASFIVACLAIYLAVLVPLNWMFFYALGRVEWAWIAAPIIALIGTVAVVRQAQLDIGFVRSQTEIALLELHGDYPRGHLSRYTALYSSLSTTYDVEFSDATAVASPFPADRRIAPGQSLLGAPRAVELEKYDHPRLRGVPVTSASTRLIHSEQMHLLDGPIRMTHPSTNPRLVQLENKSGHDLADAVVVRRRLVNGRFVYESSWLGNVRNGTTTLVPWTPTFLAKDDLPYGDERTSAARLDYRKRLAVDSLLRLAFRFAPASDPMHGGRAETRLVARIDEALPGVATTPSASQAAGATVVVAHLAMELAPPPEPDWNSPADVLGDRRRGGALDFEDEYLDEEAPNDESPP